MATWKSCLESARAPATAWRTYLEDGPPPDLAASARLQLMKLLIADGHNDAAVEERELLPAQSLSAADELLMAADRPEVRLAAARRLVVGSPSRLAALAPELDHSLAAELTLEERLARSRAWQRLGRPSRAAAELRGERWRGALEVDRRRELARAELAAGSPRAALRSLPSGRNAEAADHELRARAHRGLAWRMYPARSALAAFADCTEAGERALAEGATAELRLSALETVLECATESGRLDAALRAWRMLADQGWAADRRGWLGRRLGVALAAAGDGARVEELSAALPEHERCLRFWAAAESSDRHPVLEALSDASVTDLYGRWSREILGRPPVPPPHWAASLSPAEPPASVRRLLDAGTPEGAIRQWRRLRDLRQTRPAEALAAAELAARSGYANDAIRWLRSGFPELGTVDMGSAPENAVTAYLPLRWLDSLIAAAAEAGIEPWLIAAVARQESTFAAHAESPRGAIGVLQLLPSTGRLGARALGLGPQPDLRDPELNIRLGSLELARLRRRFGAFEPAVAAYNAGESRVRRWWREQPDPRRFAELIPVPETYTYVRRVAYLSEAYRLRYANLWEEHE
jgi:soluble lytic murein transglycosylase